MRTFWKCKIQMNERNVVTGNRTNSQIRTSDTNGARISRIFFCVTSPGHPTLRPRLCIRLGHSLWRIRYRVTGPARICSMWLFYTSPCCVFLDVVVCMHRCSRLRWQFHPQNASNILYADVPIVDCAQMNSLYESDATWGTTHLVIGTFQIMNIVSQFRKHQLKINFKNTNTHTHTHWHTQTCTTRTIKTIRTKPAILLQTNQLLSCVCNINDMHLLNYIAMNTLYVCAYEKHFCSESG